MLGAGSDAPAQLPALSCISGPRSQVLSVCVLLVGELCQHRANPSGEGSNTASVPVLTLWSSSYPRGRIWGAEGLLVCWPTAEEAEERPHGPTAPLGGL